MNLLNNAIDHLNQPGSGMKFIWLIQIVCVFIIALCLTSIYNDLGESRRRAKQRGGRSAPITVLTTNPEHNPLTTSTPQPCFT